MEAVPSNRVTEATTPNTGRPLRNQRLSSTPVIQNRYSGSKESGKKQQLVEDLLKDKLSDDDLYVGGSNREGSLNLGAGKNGSNGNLSSDQELGLDLSKKSPSASTTQDEVSPNENHQESPQSATASTANSASFEDSTTNPRSLEGGEPMEMGVGEENQSLPDTGQRKNSRHVARKKEWPKKENALDSGKGDEEATVPNGVIVGPSGGYNSEHSFKHFLSVGTCCTVILSAVPLKEYPVTGQTGPVSSTGTPKHSSETQYRLHA
ncbi:UNVERIFIED_CONTAM: hypothetical protein FKN15_075412 [Acipenser sinensis]